MANFFKKMQAYYAEQQRLRNSGVNSDSLNPDSPSVIERRHVDRNVFKFHTILRNIVQKEGEDILKDPGITDILRDYRYADISDVVLNILEEFINNNAVDFILEHETNSWDDSLSEQISDYAQRYPAKQRIIVEGIAKSIAYSVDMEVDILPFKYIVDGRSNPRRKRKTKESDDDDWAD